MTLPNGAAGLSQFPFGVSFGTLPSLPQLTQEVATGILQAEIQASTAWNRATELIWEGLERGIPLTLAIIQGLINRLFNTVASFPLVSEALASIEEVPQLRALVNALTGTDGGLVELGNFVQAQWSQLLWLMGQIEALLHAVGVPSLGQIGNQIASAQTQLATLITTAVGSGGSGFPWTFPVSWGTGSGFPWSFPISFGNVDKTIGDVGASILTGSDIAIQELKNTLVHAITGVQTGVDHSLTDIHTAVQQISAQPPLAVVQTGLNQAAVTTNQVGAIITNSLQADGAAVGAALATAGSQATNAVSQLNDAAVNAIGGANVAAGQFGQALSGFFGGLFGNWTGGSTGPTNAAAVNQAAAAAAAAAAYQAQQTAAINSQLPHFYGGSGTGGLNVNIPFTGTLPASFTSAASIAANSAIYNAATAVSDQETVSALWNTTLPTPLGGFVPNAVGPARYLFLRCNTGLTTDLYGKFWLGANGSGIAIVGIEIGCVVAGSKTVLTTDTSTSGDSHFASLAYGTQTWALEATGFAIVLTGPGGYSLPVTDSVPVSQVGSLYRSAGIGSDETGWLANITDWNFYDSGPSAGPASAVVATSETTASTTYVDLATTTDQVTVTIGPSLLAIVLVDSFMSLNTGAPMYIGVAVSGANTIAVADTRCLEFNAPGAGFETSTGIAHLFTSAQLPNQGATTFKLKYRVNSGTGTFKNRYISVIPL